MIGRLELRGGFNFEMPLPEVLYVILIRLNIHSQKLVLSNTDLQDYK